MPVLALNSTRIFRGPLSLAGWVLELDAGPLDAGALAHVLRGMLAALAYLHAQQRVHREV